MRLCQRLWLRPFLRHSFSAGILASFHLAFGGGGTVNFLSAAHQLAWSQHPTIWLCESCAILWLTVRAVRSPWVQAGVLLMLGGLTLNALVIQANAGTMPVVGISSRLHAASPLWRAATSNTRLLFLADQARLGLFSVGDLVLLFGGILVVTTCFHRTLKFRLFAVSRFACTARRICSATPAPVIAHAGLGGLHHRYDRAA